MTLARSPVVTVTEINHPEWLPGASHAEWVRWEPSASSGLRARALAGAARCPYQQGSVEEVCMHIAPIIAGLLLSGPALADCTPADAKVIAAAERKASDAEHRAEDAESIAVRSGNPGAQARATRARAEASAAQRAAAALRCEADRGPATPPPRGPTGY